MSQKIIDQNLNSYINHVVEIMNDNNLDIEQIDYTSINSKITDLTNYINGLTEAFNKLKISVDGRDFKKINLPTLNEIDTEVTKINNLISTGGSQNKDIMNLIRDGEFLNMTTTLHDNIMNMVNKSDQMMKNMLVINEQLDKINLNNKPLTRDDLNNITKYLNKVYEMINKTNNLFNLNDVKEEENNMTEMLFEKNNYGNEKVQNNILYKKMEDKNKMTKLVDLINLYNNSSKDIYEVFQGMSNKLNIILSKLNEIDDRFIRSGILPNALKEFTENSKNNTIGNLDLITRQVEQIKNMFEVKMGGNFFLKTN